MEEVKFSWTPSDWKRAQELASQVRLSDGSNLWERVRLMDSVWALHEIARVLASGSLDNR